MENSAKNRLLLFLFSLVFFLPGLGGVHLFDWDEINFAEIAREMLVTKDYLRVTIAYQPFFEKPPLFIWLQAISMAIFGVTEFAARLPNAICGIVTLQVLYGAGQRLYGNKFGILWAAAYAGSVLPFFYFKSGIIDPWFNLFIFSAYYNVVCAYLKYKGESGMALRQNSYTYTALGGAFAGLAIFCKGPAAIIILGLCFGVYWVLQRFRWFLTPTHLLIFVLPALAVPGIWFVTEYIAHGGYFITTFLVYQWRLFSTPDAGHAGFFGYHFVILLLGCFPASVFAIRAMVYTPGSNPTQTLFRTFMLILFWVVLILFSIVKSKIVHYSSLCYFPISFLAALTFYNIELQRVKFGTWLRVLYWFVGSLLMLLPVAFVILVAKVDLVIPYIQDPFAVANLASNPIFSGWEAFISLGYFVALAVAYRRLIMNRAMAASKVLWPATSIYVFLVLIFFIKKAELISQNANIEFFKSIVGRDAYITTVGYKSYGCWYYTALRPDQAPKFETLGEWNDYLLGPKKPDKAVYISSKITEDENLRRNPYLQRLYAKNGYVFYYRP